MGYQEQETSHDAFMSPLFFLATAPRQHCGGRSDGYPLMEI